MVLPRSYTKGSRILLTTRSEDVARSLARDSRILKLKPLVEEKALSLFCKKAFEQDSPPPDLKDWARRTVSRCPGLPLAIVVIGSLIMSARDADPLTWKQNLDTIYLELSSQDSIRDVVMLSLYNLPYHLKMCFLYCSVFPEDYHIGRKLLIRLWIAEGFVEPKEGTTLERVAERYLRDLAHLNLIQVVERNEAGRIRSCKLHDVVRKIAMEVSKEEELSTTQPEGALARRLSIHHDDQAIIHARAAVHSKLRSLLVFARDKQMASELGKSLKLKLLRVLDLRGVPIEKVPDVVFGLLNLTYLGLRETKVEYEVFPREIGRLRQLQTLDLWKTHVKALPAEVGCLHDLRHVMICDVAHDASYCDLPTGLENLTNLQTLKSFKAIGKENRYAKLKVLTQLRSLSINEAINTDGPELCRSIARMRNLLRLKVRSKNGNFVPLQGLSSPPPDLQKLQLHGQLRSIPLWFRSLGSLTHLYLFDSKVHPDAEILEYVEQLPSLMLLCLDNAYDGGSLRFRRGGFGSLRTLYLRQIPFLRRVEIDEGALPNLCRLYVLECRMVRQKVPQVERLPSLRELIVRGFDAAMMGAVREICNLLPNVKLLCQ